MATILTTTYSSNTAITFDVSSLSASSTFITGRESTEVDNTSNKYIDALVDINGITAGGSASGSGGTMAYSTFAPTIGANRDSTGSYTQFLNGKTDDIRIYNRALSASEVQHLYAAGIAGYRNELNWTGPRLYAPSVAATFNPAWARNSNVFMGAGA